MITGDYISHKKTDLVLHFISDCMCQPKHHWWLFKAFSYILTTENVIKENQWGGVDIRRGGDPILKNNYICYGYSDGVVVGERGRGLIEGNHVYCK